MILPHLSYPNNCNFCWKRKKPYWICRDALATDSYSCDGNSHWKPNFKGSNIKTLIVATNPAEKNEMENLNQYLESKNHELWTDNESRHDAFWPLAMTSIVGVGTLRQNPQLASIFRSKKGGSAIDNKQLWPIWMTEARDKEAANMQAIFTSSQTWTMSNSVNSVNSANSVRRS